MNKEQIHNDAVALTELRDRKNKIFESLSRGTREIDKQMIDELDEIKRLRDEILRS
jgi:hypothetical protein